MKHKLPIILLFTLTMLAARQISPTNSFYVDKTKFSKSSVTTGYWIPKIEMKVSPQEPEGKNGWYENAPCLKLKSSLPDTTIHYQFSNSTDSITGTYQKGKCLDVPEGQWDFSAIGFYGNNPQWESNRITAQFKYKNESKEEKSKDDKEAQKDDSTCSSQLQLPLVPPAN